MHRPGIGQVVIADRHLTAADRAPTLQNVELFHGSVSMRGIAGAGRETKDRRGSA